WPRARSSPQRRQRMVRLTAGACVAVMEPAGKLRRFPDRPQMPRAADASRRPRAPPQRTKSMPEYRGVDYLELDELLSEEERMVRDTTRDFVSEHVMPIIGEAYEKAEFPRQLIPMIGELGLLGANLPEEYGCAGMGA